MTEVRRPPPNDARPAADARLVARCARCQLALTLGAVEIPGSPSPITEQDGADGLPAGLFFRVETDDVWHGARLGSVVVHRGDLRNTRPSGERSGCCGPTGTDGPNLSCAHGHVVGTEVADCWTPRFVFFAPGAVVMTPDADERPEAIVRTFHAGASMTNAWPFHAWLHEALAAADWFADDTRALVAWWLAAHEGSIAVVFHGSRLARANGVAVDDIVAQVLAAQPEARGRRFTVVLV